MGSIVSIGIKLLYFSIFLTPIFGLYEYLGYLGVFPYTRNEVLMPWYYKGTKDILLVLIYICFTSAIFLKKKLKNPPIFFLLFFLFLFFEVSLNIIVLEDYFLLLAGIRSLSTLFLAFFSYAFFSDKEIRKLANLIVFIAILMVPLSLIQLLFGSHIYGMLFDTFAARVTATFVQPNSLGVFLVLSVFLVRLFSLRYKNFLTFIFASIIILTGSGISILAISLMSALFIAKKNINFYLRFVFILPLPLLIYLIYAYLPIITNRPDIFQSQQGRMEIIKDYFLSNLTLKDIFLGKGFGYGTNTLFTVYPDIASYYGIIPDSLYVSLFSQIGVIGILFFLFLNGYVYMRSKHPLKDLILLLLFCGLATNILELFPVNWIYPIMLGFLLKKKYSVLSHVTSMATWEHNTITGAKGKEPSGAHWCEADKS
jgi:hypothetical protein